MKPASQTDHPATYDASSIVVLSGLDAVRLRPAMYVGSTGADGLHRLVLELVENAVDEALAGVCQNISVELTQDGSCVVSDDGRGIPVDLHPELRQSGVEVVLTTLHAGSKFGGGRSAYRITTGLHGVGLSCVNALSRWLEVVVHRDGGVFRQSYAQGKPEGPLERIGDSVDHGTKIHFIPDPEIFGTGSTARLSFDVIAGRLQELAYLTPGVGLSISDARDQRSEEYRYTDGIIGFVSALNRARTPVHADSIHIRGLNEGIQVEAVLQWTRLYSDDTRTFVNTVRTPDGGTHLVGFQSALTSVVSRYAADHDLFHSDLGEGLRAADIREGLTAVLTVELSNPEFSGQTKSVLGNPNVRQVVFDQVSQDLRAFLDDHPDQARAILDKTLEAYRIRQAARRAREGGTHQVIFEGPTPEAYRTQFSIRSSNWHDSAIWIANHDLLAAHAAMCQVPPTARLLDVCCGSGVVGGAFRDKVAHITGLDITPAMIALAKTRQDEVVQGTVYDIPFPDEHFEIVSNREVMHLMPEPRDMLSEVWRVLKKDGQFIFGQIVPYGADDAAWMYRIFRKKQPLFHHMFLQEDLVDLLKEMGFSDIETSEFLLWESIDTWIDTVETTRRHRQEIRDIYYNAPADVKAIHPFEVLPDGRIRDCWRWVVFSARKR